MPSIARLPDRAVLAVSGEDRVAYLQGLVSNDVAQAAPGRAVWAALLTPQGKWLADFFILADGDRLLLDVRGGQRRPCAAAADALPPARPGDRRARPLHVHAGWDGPPPAGAVACARPAAARRRLARAAGAAGTTTRRRRL